MSASSYPSPISSAPSPRLSGSPMTNGPSTANRTSRARPLHRSLQSASASLDAAFARLEQVRTDLMDLSRRIPDVLAQSRARDQVGPTHDAIMLTGEPGDEPWEQHQPRAQGTPSGEESELIYAYENAIRRTVQARNSLAQIEEQSSALRQYPPTNPATLEIPIHSRVQYQPLPIDTQSSRNIDLALRDDSFTALGRNVVAREAAALRMNRDEAAGTSNEQAQPLPQTLAGSRSAMLEDALQRTMQSNDPNEIRRLNQLQNQLSSPVSSPWRQGFEARRRRPNRTDTRPPSTRTSASGTTNSAATADHASRLSMLSSFSIQNFSSPVSAAPSITRPLLFEEPESYSESPIQQNESDMMVFEEGPFGGRNYVIRRHLNAEGRERVQNINLEFTEPSWNQREDSSEMSYDNARRRTMLQSFERAQRPVNTSSPVNPPSSHIPGGVARRRGWARLDPDGNEIPPDDEEELERNRTEYRIRATNRARSLAAMYPNTAPVPPDMTRAMAYGSVMDSVANVSDSFRMARQYESVTVVDKDDYTCGKLTPLPMPLDEMVSGGACRDAENEYVVVMSHSASHAGR